MPHVFLQSPWIHPEEPEPLKRIFRTLGRRLEVPAGALLPYETTEPLVGLLESGLGAFSFTDRQGRGHTFALILPGRVFGDLDVISGRRPNLHGMAIRRSTILILERSRWQAALEMSTELMRVHVRQAIIKQECHMEGMIANYTLDLAERMKALLRSVIESWYPLRTDGWNPLPIALNVTEISRIVSANRSSASVILSRWTDEGLVRRDGRRLILHGSLFEDPEERITPP